MYQAVSEESVDAIVLHVGVNDLKTEAVKQSSDQLINCVSAIQAST